MLSHLGRPNGERNTEFSLRPVADKLEELLGRKIKFLDDCVGESVINEVRQSNNDIFLC